MRGNSRSLPSVAVLAIATAIALGGSALASPAGAAETAPAGSGRPLVWKETSVGTVSIQGLAEPDGHTTWASGMEVVDGGAPGFVTFTPALYSRDLRGAGAWRRVTLPSTTVDSRLNDVDAVSTNVGFMVGDLDPKAGVLLTEVRERGTWRVVTDTVDAGAIGASLLAVDALTAKNAWAVGEVQIDSPEEGSYFKPLVRHWDGARWRHVDIPGSKNWSLSGVTALSTKNVWAVGTDYDQGQPLTVHYDGVSWKRVPAPSYQDSGVLINVTSGSGRDVWAVGWYREEEKERPRGLVLHYDGRKWNEVPLPAGTFMVTSVAATRNGVVVVGGGDDGVVGLRLVEGKWRSLGLPQSEDLRTRRGVSTVSASGSRLTVGGYTFLVGDDSDEFVSGSLLTTVR
ncbi:hypothetical protein [Actinopolymorpha pittospori]